MCNCALTTKKDTFFAWSRCCRSFVAQQNLILRCAVMSGKFCRATSFAQQRCLYQIILINHGRDNHHCLHLMERGRDVGMPVVYGFITSSGGTHTALCRDIIYIVYIIFYRYLYIRPIYITLYIELRESQTATITFSSMWFTADCMERLAHTTCTVILFILYILYYIDIYLLYIYIISYNII